MIPKRISLLIAALTLYPISAWAGEGAIGYVAADGTKHVFEMDTTAKAQTMMDAGVTASTRTRKKKGTFSVIDSFKYTSAWSGCSGSGRSQGGGMFCFITITAQTIIGTCAAIAKSEQSTPPKNEPNMVLTGYEMRPKGDSLFPNNEYVCRTNFNSSNGYTYWDHVIGTSTPSAPASADSYSDANKGACDADPQEKISAHCGNPIHIGTGNKFQRELDYSHSVSPLLKYERFYNSIPTSIGQPSAMPDNWSDSFHAFLMPDADESAWGMQAYRPDGRLIIFKPQGTGLFYSATTPNETLVSLGSGAVSPKWRYTNAYGVTEDYDISGRLLSITNMQGERVTLSYDSGNRLIAVNDTNRTGLGLTFSYSNPYINSISLVAPNATPKVIATFAYDEGKATQSGRLTSVTYADSKRREYRYDDPDFTDALTSLIDENGSTFATWKYNDDGLAYESSHAGDAEKVTLTYGADDLHVSSLSSTGVKADFVLADVAGSTKVNQRNLSCAPANCAGNTALVRDTKGNVTQKTDALGAITRFSYDAIRNLETSRTEAFGTPQARTITTTWHPTLRLPATVTEPGQLTTYDYFPATSNLKSKTITADGKTRIWSWTYGEVGRIKTATNPDGKITSYTYDTLGNLATLTNPLNQITKFTLYDANGNLLEMTAADGLKTMMTYDARDRLKTRKIGSALTSYDYWPTGLLKQVTLPNGQIISYVYDDAHRLKTVSDNRGNSVVYTLNTLGQAERIDKNDPNGTLTVGLAQAQSAQMPLNVVKAQ